MNNSYPIPGDFFVLNAYPKYYDFGLMWDGEKWLESKALSKLERKKWLEIVNQSISDIVIECQ